MDFKVALGKRIYGADHVIFNFNHIPLTLIAIYLPFVNGKIEVNIQIKIEKTLNTE